MNYYYMLSFFVCFGSENYIPHEVGVATNYYYRSLAKYCFVNNNRFLQHVILDEDVYCRVCCELCVMNIKNRPKILVNIFVAHSSIEFTCKFVTMSTQTEKDVNNNDFELSMKTALLFYIDCNEWFRCIRHSNNILFRLLIFQ